MNWKLKLVGLSILSGLLLVWATQSVAQDDRNYIPKQVHPCIDAKGQMGDEWHHAELMAARESGEADCEIIIMFAKKKTSNKFEELRKKKGLSPNFVDYKGRKIKIAKTIGEMGPH